MAGLSDKGITLVVLLLVTFDVFSIGVANSFYVTDVRADRSGKGYIRFDKPLVAEGDLPSCSTHKNHLAFDVNAPAGMSIMSLALAAQASGTPVYAKGTGECDVYGTVESWAWGQIE